MSDLASGLTRSYGTRPWSGVDQGVGKGWQLNTQPSLVLNSQDEWAAVTFDSRDTYWYDVSGNSYTPRFGIKQTLTADTADNLFKFVETDGTVYEFNDFQLHPDLEQGQLAKIVSPNGATAVVNYSPSGQDAGKVNTIQYFAAGQTQPYQVLTYAYIAAGDPNAGEVQSITLQGYTRSPNNWSISRKQPTAITSRTVRSQTARRAT